MSEAANVKTGEIVEAPTDELVPVGVSNLSDKDLKELRIKEQDLPMLRIMETLDTFDWKQLPPHKAALILTTKPFPVSGGGSMFLNFKQAILFATRCFELGLSPFSSEVWFDANRGSVNLTLEGKRQLLRNRGIDVGPPSFEEKTRPWSDVAKTNQNIDFLQKLGYTQDMGVMCSMRVGKPEHKEYVTYTAWLSEWCVEKSPVWKSKPMHMLTTRATEKAISLVLGTGASSMPDERDLDNS